MNRIMSRLATTFCTLAIPFVIATSGCSTFQDSRIPGTENDPFTITKMDTVPPISNVIAALKIQMGEAFKLVPNIKAKNDGNPAAAGLNPQTGTGVFSGTTQLVQTDSANVMAVFPFTGYTGSTLTPNLGVSSAATGIQNTTLTFSVNPNVSAANEMRRSVAKSQNIDVGDHITKTLVAAFEEIASVPYKADGTGYDPQLTNRELKLSMTFAVVQTFDAGLGVKIVPTTPDVTSITGSPALGLGNQKTGTYKLDLTIPLVTPETTDPKRILHGTVNLANGAVLIIDRPFTKEFIDQQKQGGPKSFMTPLVPGTPDPLQVEPEFEF